MFLEDGWTKVCQDRWWQPTVLTLLLYGGLSWGTLAQITPVEVTVLALDDLGTRFDFQIDSAGVCRIYDTGFGLVHKMSCSGGAKFKLAIKLKLASRLRIEKSDVIALHRDQVIVVRIDSDGVDRAPDAISYPRRISLPSTLCVPRGSLEWVEVKGPASDAIYTRIAVNGCLIELPTLHSGHYSAVIYALGKVRAIGRFESSFQVAPEEISPKFAIVDE